MDIERALISKIISTGQLEEAISRGVREDLFFDDECREMFSYILAHKRRYKSPPSMAAVKEDRPDFEWIQIQDPLEWVISKFAIGAKRRLANEYVLELAAALDDPDRAEKIDMEFLEISRKLAQLVPHSQVARFSEVDKRIAEYEARKKEGKKLGIPMGFPTIDDMTGGIQPHEFVTVSAFSGIGKSTLLKRIAFNTWAQGFTPLIITLEEESSQILRHFDAMAANLDYQKMKQLDLPEDMMNNWRDVAREIQGRTNDIPVIDSIRHCTADHIFAETVRHKPDLVIVDYLSLMRSSAPSRGVAQWQSLTEITQDMKQNARTLRIPIVAAAQSNRASGKEGAELDNIGYALSVIQDSDIVLGLFADDEMKKNKQMEIRVNKNRDGRLGRVKAIWDHDELDFREAGLGDLFKRNGAEQHV